MLNIKDYTLILIHYAQTERLIFALQTWSKQSWLPLEIIIVDDGTPLDPKILDNFKGHLNIKLLQMKHTGNLGFMINYAMLHLSTSFYLILEPSLLPVGDFFAEKMLSRSEKGQQAIPLYGTTGSLNAFQNKGEFVLYEHTFGNNQTITGDQKTKMINNCLKRDVFDEGTLYHSFYFPIDGFMKHKDDFLRYNETFDCWGCYDLDYQFRIVLNKIKSYCYTDMAFIHWDHPKVGSMYQKPQNLKYLSFCQTYYQTNKITYLTIEKALEIQQLYVKQ